MNQTESQKPINLSVVILCYQAGESTRQFVLNAIKEFSDNQVENYELILVGNYHPEKNDSTPKIVKQLSQDYDFVKYVAKPKEGMMGWDMRSGLEVAQGKLVAVIDGDGQMPIIDVVRVYEKIKNSDYDLVKTYRTKRGDGHKRKVISFFYNLVFKLLFPGINSRDVNSKPKIFKNKSLKKLNLVSSDWFVDAEIMIEAQKHRLKIKEIPTDFLKLEDRASYVKTSAIIEFVKNLLAYRFLKNKKDQSHD